MMTIVRLSQPIHEATGQTVLGLPRVDQGLAENPTSQGREPYGLVKVQLFERRPGELVAAALFVRFILFLLLFVFYQRFC
jgi:hypothetical protein